MGMENQLITRYLRDHPPHAARNVERLEPEEMRKVLEGVPPEAAAGILSALRPALAAQCLFEMPPPLASALIEHIPDQAAAGILRRYDAQKQDEFLVKLQSRRADRLRRLLRYNKNSVGAVMDLEYLQYFGDDTVEEVLRAPRASTASGTVYVVTRDQKLIGVTSMRKLRASPADAKLATLGHPAKATLSPKTDCSVAAVHPCWLEVDEAPIAGFDGRLLGVLRHLTLRARAEEPLDPSHAGADAVLAVSELVWMGLHGLMETLLATTRKDGRND